MGFRRTLLLFMVLFGCGLIAPAFGSAADENSATLLREQELGDTVRRGSCIVMYFTTDAGPADDEARKVYGASPLQIGDTMVKDLLKYKERTASPVRIYKANWKGYADAAVQGRIRKDLDSASKFPASPGFVVYKNSGSVTLRIQGPLRFDTYAWAVNDLAEQFIPSVKTDKGEFTLAGWTITDTNARWVNLVDSRKESMDLAGKTEKVQVNVYRSRPVGGLSCTYERVLLPNGFLVASIESCDGYGRVGYFDYSQRGKMQYRMKYPEAAGKELASGASSTP